MRMVPCLLGGGAGYDALGDCGGGLLLRGERVGAVIVVGKVIVG